MRKFIDRITKHRKPKLPESFSPMDRGDFMQAQEGEFILFPEMRKDGKIVYFYTRWNPSIPQDIPLCEYSLRGEKVGSEFDGVILQGLIEGTLQGNASFDHISILVKKKNGVATKTRIIKIGDEVPRNLIYRTFARIIEDISESPTQKCENFRAHVYQIIAAVNPLQNTSHRKRL